MDEVPVMTVDEEIGYSHAVPVNWQPLVFRQDVVDMAYLWERVSEHVRGAILSAVESGAD